MIFCFAASSQSSTEASSGNSDSIYNPSKPKYHPIEDACWKQGEKLLFSGCIFLKLSIFNFFLILGFRITLWLGLLKKSR